MKQFLPFLLLGAILPGINSCDMSEDFSGPTADIRHVNAGQSFITFEISTDKSDEVAYKVTAADAASLTAEQLFSEGTVVLPGYPGCEHALEASTEYTIYAASRTSEGTYSKVTSYKVRTKEAGHFKADISFINYIAIAFKEITPDDLNRKYAIVTVSGNLDQSLKEIGLDDIEELPAYLYDNDMMDDRYITSGQIKAWEGDIGVWFFNNPDTEITFCFWYINEDKSPASPIEYVTTRTAPVPDRSYLCLDLYDFQVLTDRLYLKIKTNGTGVEEGIDPVYFETWSGISLYKASLFREGMTDYEIAETVLDYWLTERGITLGQENSIRGHDGYWCYFDYRTENRCNCYPDYEPGEEYLLVFFGTCAGKITTDPVIRRFTMPDDGKGDIKYDAPSFARQDAFMTTPCWTVNSDLHTGAR